MDVKELNEDTSIKSKQDYLKKEIIDKNYNQDKFIDYCLHKKENGDDLNCWGFEELQEAVQDFIRLNSETKKFESKESEEMNVEQVEKLENYNVSHYIYSLLIVRLVKIKILKTKLFNVKN